MLSILNSVRKRDEPVPVDGPVPAAPARTLILGRCAPAGLRVHGHLDLSNSPNLVELPAHRARARGCTALQALPAGLHVYELQMQYARVRSLPPDLRVEYRLDLEGCTEPRSLPAGLKTGSLILRKCIALESLPEGLDVYFLDITGCTGLRGWPHAASVRIGRLNERGCAGLRALPPWLTTLAQLDISGCANLNALPEGLRVSSWIDLANTGITSLPASLQGVRLRWRGVPIDTRIAFQPETITIREILGEPNAELRRGLLERMGYAPIPS